MTTALNITPLDRAADYAARLSGQYDRRMESEIWRGSAGWNSPSVIGHPCDRFLVLRRTKGELQHPTTIETQKRFERGKVIGRLAQMTLASYGFDIIRMEAQVEYRALMLRGKADLVARPAELSTPYQVYEVKSAASSTFNSVDSIEDIKRHRRHYIRSYPYQAMAYLMLERHKRSRQEIDKEVATLWLWNPDNWQWKFIPVPYDGAIVEEITDKCGRVNEHIAARTEPPPINDPDVCPDCSFFMTDACNPHLAMAPDVGLVTDEDDIEGVRRLLELKPLASEYEAIQKRLKVRFEGVTQALVPDVAMVTGRQVERQMKAQEARVDTFWQVKYLPLMAEENQE